MRVASAGRSCGSQLRVANARVAFATRSCDSQLRPLANAGATHSSGATHSFGTPSVPRSPIFFLQHTSRALAFRSHSEGCARSQSSLPIGRRCVAMAAAVTCQQARSPTRREKKANAKKAFDVWNASTEKLLLRVHHQRLTSLRRCCLATNHAANRL